MLGEKAGLFAANPRAFRFRLGRCGFSAAIPTREERAKLGIGNSYLKQDGTIEMQKRLTCFKTICLAKLITTAKLV